MFDKNRLTCNLIESVVDHQESKQLDVSWKVACGANAAYDQFPSQNQVRVCIII